MEFPLEPLNPPLEKPRWLVIGFVIFLVVWTVFIFFPVITAQFTNWDDQAILLNNPDVKDFSPSGLLKLFRRPSIGHYCPLVYLSFSLEIHFFGLQPVVFHLTNLFLHVFNSLLAFLFLYQMRKDHSFALLGSLLFAVHPLRAESVAWISMRTDVLYGFFFLSGLNFYLWETSEQGSKRFPLLTLIAFILSSLCKAMAITFPVLLLLIDLFSKSSPGKSHLREKIVSSQKLAGNAEGAKRPTAGDEGCEVRAQNLAPLLHPEGGRVPPFMKKLQKIPFFLVSLLLAIMVLTNTKHSKSPVAIESALDTITIPSYCLTFYVEKTFFPFGLSMIYQCSRKIGSFFPMRMALSPLLLILFAIFSYHKRGTLTWGFGPLFYLICLLPVLQIPASGSCIVADRYSYIASLGLSFFFVGILLEAWKALGSQRALRGAFFLIFVIVFAFLGYLTNLRVKVWHDSQTLFLDGIKTAPESEVPFVNLGAYFIRKERSKIAKTILLEGLKRFPEEPRIRYLLWVVYVTHNQLEEAKGTIKGMQHNGLHPNHLGALASFCIEQGDLIAADFFARAAVEKDPHFFEGHFILGNLLRSQGNIDKAKNHFDACLDLKPDSAKVHCLLGIVLRNIDPKKAENHFKLAIRHGRHETQVLYTICKHYLETYPPNSSQFSTGLKLARQIDRQTNSKIPEYVHLLKSYLGKMTSDQE